VGVVSVTVTPPSSSLVFCEGVAVVVVVVCVRVEMVLVMLL
jgi:hypothetical protein